jgi:hypothetical protein
MEMHATRTLAADRASGLGGAERCRSAQGLHPWLRGIDRQPRRGFRGGGQAEGRTGQGHLQGPVTLSDVVAGESYTISGEGKGGVAGLRQGRRAGERSAMPRAAAPILHYDVEAKVGGKIAQLGSRLIDSFARKMADQFFERFAAHVEGRADGDGDGNSRTA